MFRIAVAILLVVLSSPAQAACNQVWAVALFARAMAAEGFEQKHVVSVLGRVYRGAPREFFASMAELAEKHDVSALEFADALYARCESRRGPRSPS